jgi:hypothetical protein
MTTVIKEALATLGGRGRNVSIQALVPFSARLPQDQVQSVAPSSFDEADFGSHIVLLWEATTVIARNSHGNYKLYLCPILELGIWVPMGDWFFSNRLPASVQCIADYAKAVSGLLSIDHPSASIVSSSLANRSSTSVHTDLPDLEIISSFDFQVAS